MTTTPTQLLDIPMGSPSAPPDSMVIYLMDETKFPNGLTLFTLNTYSSGKFDDLRIGSSLTNQTQ